MTRISITQGPHLAAASPPGAEVWSAARGTGGTDMVWYRSDGPVSYPDAIDFMTRRAEAIARGDAPEAIWLLEHPALYTAGTSARPEDLREPSRFEVFPTRRGGQYTYHGPGQRVVYVMLDLARHGRDLRRFVRALEGWIIAVLAEFGLTGQVRPGRVGVWIERPDRPVQPDGRPAEDKIAAIGIRVRRWISFHGLAINVEPELDHFEGIVPCGITDYGVTSLVDLGLPVSMSDLDLALLRQAGHVLGHDR